jgi:hypothetical protein
LVAVTGLHVVLVPEMEAVVAVMAMVVMAVPRAEAEAEEATTT